MRTFAFTGRWHLDAPVDEVASVLVDLAGYPAWWPQVLAVAALGTDDARVLCRSRLPYTLDLVLTAVSREAPRLESRVSGDLRGSVAWVLTSAGAGTALELEQEVHLAPGPLAWSAYVAGPALRWNHDQMMAGGIAGLRAHLAAGVRPPGAGGS